MFYWSESWEANKCIRFRGIYESAGLCELGSCGDHNCNFDRADGEMIDAVQEFMNQPIVRLLVDVLLLGYGFALGWLWRYVRNERQS